jgi:hypothetical protein
MTFTDKWRSVLVGPDGDQKGVGHLHSRAASDAVKRYHPERLPHSLCIDRRSGKCKYLAAPLQSIGLAAHLGGLATQCDDLLPTKGRFARLSLRMISTSMTNSPIRRLAS